ncbi:MAG: BamA/TamA family outer membrane protein [Gammaproteobacteria bacterium]|nr:BamA/TamA family outer membrane protein [Gammaproteobacteria bacterium]
MIYRTLLISGVALFFTAGPAHGEDRDFDLPAAEMGDTIADGGLELTDVDFEGSPLKRFAEKWPDDLVIAPIPGRSPQVGWTLALGGGYFLGSKDEDSDVAPSILGGFGWYAENGSYAFGAGGNLHLLDDDLRVKFGAGYMDVRYRYYGRGSDQNNMGIYLDILQEAPMYFGSASYRVWKKLYVGLGYVAGNVDTRAEIVIPDGLLADPRSLDIGAITIPITVDTRDHEQFPRRGWLMEGRTMLYRKDVGSDFDAETYKVSLNRYIPVRENDVLAFRGYFRTTGGNAPFFILSTFGGSSDLRGYPSGRYRDKAMYALQGEYRWAMNDRWIFTGFAGFGEVAPDFGSFGGDYLPAAGVGARFVMSQKHRVSLSFDVAQGKDGTEYYFGVGEAF